MKGCIMEFVGTFAMCFVGGMTSTAPKNGLIRVGLTHGLVLGGMIYGGAHLREAHYNPAVESWFLMFVICGSAVDGRAPKGVVNA